jgi:MSHA pilin protein MshA
MTMKSYSNRSSGFTLIELIVVIVILGILAVTAAPKFINFSTDARISTLKGLQGAVNAAMNLTQAASKIKGTTSLGGGIFTLSLDGDTIFLTALGYPASWASGLIHVVSVDPNEWEIDPLTLAVRIRPKGMVDSEDCYFQYDPTNFAAKPILSTVVTEC